MPEDAAATARRIVDEVMARHAPPPPSEPEPVPTDGTEAEDIAAVDTAAVDTAEHGAGPSEISHAPDVAGTDVHDESAAVREPDAVDAGDDEGVPTQPMSRADLEALEPTGAAGVARRIVEQVLADAARKDAAKQRADVARQAVARRHAEQERAAAEAAAAAAAAETAEAEAASETAETEAEEEPSAEGLEAEVHGVPSGGLAADDADSADVAVLRDDEPEALAASGRGGDTGTGDTGDTDTGDTDTSDTGTDDPGETDTGELVRRIVADATASLDEAPDAEDVEPDPPLFGSRRSQPTSEPTPEDHHDGGHDGSGAMATGPSPAGPADPAADDPDPFEPGPPRPPRPGDEPTSSLQTAGPADHPAPWYLAGPEQPRAGGSSQTWGDAAVGPDAAHQDRFLRFEQTVGVGEAPDVHDNGEVSRSGVAVLTPEPDPEPGLVGTPAFVWPDEEPETTDLDLAPEEAEPHPLRWILVGLVGAAALAVLLPLAVAALRAAVALD